MEALWEFLSELVAFVVVAFVIWRYLRPPVSKIIQKQRETIGKQVENTRLAAERLQQAELKFQEAIAEARTESAKIRDTARADAQRIVEEMREHANREVERIRQRGQEDLETQRLQVVRELRARIGQLTASTASELVTAHLSDDAKRARTVDRFLDELEAMSARETTTPAGAPVDRRRAGGSPEEAAAVPAGRRPKSHSATLSPRPDSGTASKGGA